MTELYYTYPTQQVLEFHAERTPKYMNPNTLPQAAIAVQYLTDAECKIIIQEMMQIEPHQMRGCGAVTRECPRNLGENSLSPIESFARRVNSMFWGYDLWLESQSWFQTYKKGGDYQQHVDGAPGQTRKLTAVAMLTDPSEYEGGELHLIDLGERVYIPRERGTIVVFQPWQLHEVTPVTSGVRQTINMGFWGPKFR